MNRCEITVVTKKLSRFPSSLIDFKMDDKIRAAIMGAAASALAVGFAIIKHYRAIGIEDSHIQLISGQLREIAVAISKLSPDQIVTSDLYEEVMKIEGFEESMLVDAFDYLVENEKQAKAFMAKSVNLRKAWIEKFVNQR